MVADIALERGQTPTDALFDIVIADELRTVLWPENRDNSEEAWKLRAEAWEDPHILLGGSDAGAHLDRMCGSAYTSEFLGQCLRGHKLLSVERAVQLITQVPADLFGLRERGRIQTGYFADLVILDPETVGRGEIRRARDLPDNSFRLTADPIGVKRVFVNGKPIVADGVPTGLRPGNILRSGRDTRTAPLC
jgi:N-acyl-D-aspartate/D-glutamate deacylase